MSRINRRRTARAKMYLAAGVALFTANAASWATITVTPNGSDFTINNGDLTVNFHPSGQDITSVKINSDSSPNLLGTTSELDPEFAGTPFHYNSNTQTASVYQDPGGNFVDFWTTQPSGVVTGTTINPITYSFHYVMYNNSPDISVYQVLNHSSTDPSASVGQGQFLFRGNSNFFQNTYQVNTDGPFFQGVQATSNTYAAAQPTWVSVSTNTVRQIQNAATAVNGSALTGDFGTSFFTKYDWSSYEQFHQGQEMYGSQYAVSWLLPNQDTLTGGPTKQNLNFTDPTIVTGEFMSDHYGLLNSPAYGYNVAAGQVANKLYGPYVFQITPTNGESGAQLFQQGTSSLNDLPALYATDPQLTGAAVGQGGYITYSQRGAVIGTLGNTASGSWGNTGTITTNTVVLSDNQTNFQESGTGYQYWTQVNNNGSFDINNVVPGTYRMSIYQLGQWGETRVDGVTVQNGKITVPQNTTFTPENFSTSAPIWTVGTPDRSSHEFLDGDTASGNRQYYGAYDMWAQEQALGTPGYLSYYATPENNPANPSQVLQTQSNPATNWIGNQWKIFNPNLYDPTTNTSNFYQTTAPAYVRDAAHGGTGPGPGTYAGSAWQVHFVTTTAQQAQGQYVDISVGLAAVEASLTATLNGHALTWSYNSVNDVSGPMYRSGDAGFYEWLVFQFPTTDLVAAGTTTANDNVLTFGVSQNDGVMYDALRMEIDNAGANPSVTGWNDYNFIDGSGTVSRIDTVGLAATNSFNALGNGIWQLNTGGTWNDGNDWSNTTIPNTTASSVLFAAAINPSTVTLDGSHTVSAITFNSTSAYNITQGTGGALILDTGSLSTPATITTTTGSHTISASIVLNSNTNVTVSSPTDSLTLAGNIGGAGGLSATTGSLILSGSNFYSGPTSISNGASITLAGSTGSSLPAGNTVSNNGRLTIFDHVTAANVTGTGSTTLMSGSRLTLAQGGANVATQNSVTLNGSAVLDINDNMLVLSDGGNPAAATATYGGYISNGYNGATFTGPGIISSKVASVNAAKSNTHLYAIGYADASDPAVAADHFASGTFVIKPAIVGDANLDGVVNFTDFQLLAASFNGVNTSWDQGDFNYAGKTNFTDFQLLAANFNDSTTLDSAEFNAMNQFAETTGHTLIANPDGNGFTVVPEPASLGMLGVAALVLARRKRRSSISRAPA